MREKCRTATTRRNRGTVHVRYRLLLLYGFELRILLFEWPITTPLSPDRSSLVCS